MNNKKNIKRALFSSALSLLICMIMFFGTTVAWFSDEVTNAGNEIQSGILVVDLEVLEADNKTWTSVKESKEAIFHYDKWEPGYTEVKILKVQNEGTLAFEWHAEMVASEELSALAEVIDVYIKTNATEYPVDRTLVEDGWERVGSLIDFADSIEVLTKGIIETGENNEYVLGIALKMHDFADVKYQGMALGEFDIDIIATQYTEETSDVKE